MGARHHVNAEFSQERGLVGDLTDDRARVRARDLTAGL